MRNFRRHNEFAAAAAVSLAAIYLFFIEYLPPFRRVHFFSDIQGYHFPLLQHAFQSIREGRFPQWDHTMYCGMTFAGNIQAALFYPPNWLMFALNLRRQTLSYLGLEALVMIHLWTGFLLFFRWARQRGLDRTASALSAAGFAVGGYMLSQFNHVGVVTGFAWTPLALWGIDQAIARRSWRPYWKVAAASALCFLAGYPSTWVVLCCSVTAYAIARWNWRAVAGSAGALVFSLLLVLPQLLTAWSAAQMKTFDPKFGAGIRDPEFYVSLLVPNYFDFGRNAYGWGADSGQYLYLGAPCILGLVLLVRGRGLRAHLPALAIAAIGVTALTNPLNLPHRILEQSRLLIQVFHGFGFLASLHLAACMIAAASLDRLLRGGSRQAPRWAAPALILLMAAWSARQFAIWLPGGADFPARFQGALEPAIAVALLALGLLATRAESGRMKAVLACAVVAFVVGDYKAFGTSRAFSALPGDADRQFRPPKIPGMDETVYETMRAHPEFRLALDEGNSPLTTDMRHHRLATPQGFDPLLTVNYRRFVESHLPFRTDREFNIPPEAKEFMRITGVRWYITRPGQPAHQTLSSDPEFRLMQPSENYYSVFELIDARPAYGFDGPSTSGTVQRRLWLPEVREFSVESHRGGLFTLAEQAFPGWHATIDGREVPVRKWRGAFQAIDVSAGRHLVRFEYRAPGLAPGLLVSGIALLALLGMALRPGRACEPPITVETCPQSSA